MSSFFCVILCNFDSCPKVWISQILWKIYYDDGGGEWEEPVRDAAMSWRRQLIIWKSIKGAEEKDSGDWQQLLWLSGVGILVEESW
jgi:hypothetical protein